MKIKVAYVSHYNHYRMGGQKSMLALIENLDRNKYQPYCILPSEGPLADKLRELNCQPIFTELTSIKLKHLFKAIFAPIRYRKIINTFGFDIIHPDSPPDAFLFGLAKLNTKAKLIWHVRITGAKLRDKIYEKVVDGIIGISNGCRKRFSNTSKVDNKYITIYNGVDTVIFTDVDKKDKKKELNLSKNSFLILFAGVLKESKGIFELVKAIEIVKKLELVEKPIMLYILGKEQSPEIKDKLLNLIVEKNLEEAIILAGQKENIYDWMQAAEVLVLPSHEGSEGMGRVVFEAMACGTVPIVSDISGVNEAVSENAGFKFEEKNYQDMAEKMLYLYNNDEVLKEHRFSCRQRAENVFDIRIHAKKVMTFYEKILKL